MKPYKPSMGILQKWFCSFAGRLPLKNISGSRRSANCQFAAVAGASFRRKASGRLNDAVPAEIAFAQTTQTDSLRNPGGKLFFPWVTSARGRMFVTAGYERRIIFFVILAAILSTGAFAQTPPATSQSISGRVILDDGQPAAGASIEASPIGARSRGYEATADEAGNFKLAELAAGSYIISASAPGFVVEGNQASKIYRAGESVTLRLVKGGVITGRVTDVADEPLVGVEVILYRIRDEKGNLPGIIRIINAKTDDRGIYRAFGLEPGAYIIGVEVDSGGGYGARDVPTWYPATTRAAANEVVVHVGEEVTNIDIRHRGGAGYAISGTVSGETESSLPFGGIGVVVFDAATKAPVAQGYTTGESKSFNTAGLADGEYEIIAQVYAQEGEMAASSPRHITIRGADVTGIGLKLATFGSLSGRVLIERPASISASNPPPKCDSKNQIEEILIHARSEGRNPRSMNALMAENNRPTNRIAPDAKGEFAIRSLEADSYRIETDLPGENWYVRSITQPVPQPASGAAKRTDAARSGVNLKSGEKLSGIEIAIAEGAAGLKGRVVAAKENQKLPSSLRIYLVPAEPAAAEDVLRYQEIMAGKDRFFEFKHLAPGKYFLLARSVSENEVNSATLRPAAFDPIQRTQLRREAEAAKNEITLQPCQRAKDVAARFAVEK